MHHFEQPARTRVVRQSVDRCDFSWINGPRATLAFQRTWNSRKQSEAVGSGPAGSCQNCQSAVFFDKKNCSRKTHFFWRVQRETVGNSWKQLGLVPLTRQKKGCLEPVYEENEPKMVQNSPFAAESKVPAPTVSNCFPLNFQKNNGFARKKCKKNANW